MTRGVQRLDLSPPASITSPGRGRRAALTSSPSPREPAPSPRDGAQHLPELATWSQWWWVSRTWVSVRSSRRPPERLDGAARVDHHRGAAALVGDHVGVGEELVVHRAFEDHAPQRILRRSARPGEVGYARSGNAGGGAGGAGGRGAAARTEQAGGAGRRGRCAGGGADALDGGGRARPRARPQAGAASRLVDLTHTFRADFPALSRATSRRRRATTARTIGARRLLRDRTGPSGEHTATHMDAPAHFIEDGPGRPS